MTLKPDSEGPYEAVRRNLERWLREHPEKLELFSDLIENPTIEKIVDHVNRRTPVGIGIAVEVINAIFV